MKSQRLLLFAILALAIFLAGFVPMWRKAREQGAQREKAEHALTVTKIVKDLGSAAVDSRRGEYEAARQEASAFFTETRYEVDLGDKSGLSKQQRDALGPLLAPRDDLITLLARSDPASANRLANLYVSVRKVLGL